MTPDTGSCSDWELTGLEATYPNFCKCVLLSFEQDCCSWKRVPTSITSQFCQGRMYLARYLAKLANYKHCFWFKCVDVKVGKETYVTYLLLLDINVEGLVKHIC